MSTYFFRPVLPGICAECGEPYPAWEGRMHLTAKGVVHPDCDPDAEDWSMPAPSVPRRPKLAAVTTFTEETGTAVCRGCWEVHSPGTPCRKQEKA